MNALIYVSLVEFGGEGASLALLVPFLHPGQRADGVEVLEKELARLIVLALNIKVFTL